MNASVARAAGGVEATASVSINCTEFLETFRDECSHRVVMTPELSEEWDENQSKFAATWLRSMIARKRWDYVEPPVHQALRDEIEGTATSENEIEDMQKDFHLLEAARQPTKPSFRSMKPSGGFSPAPLNMLVKSETSFG